MLLFIKMATYTHIHKQISKHRMLLFILVLTSPIASPTVFQNIVCYCLSYKPICTVHHGNSFQNIVCYCLSYNTLGYVFHSPISKHRMLLFIFNQFSHNIGLKSYFKTSYVTVYHSTSKLDNSVLSNFKTSYVTVYLICFSKCFGCCVISKHRMLLFIAVCVATAVVVAYFKTSYVTVYH